MNELPEILSVGHFDTSEKYKNVITTPQRIVTEYELELYDEDGGIAHINNVSYHIQKGNILLAKPGDMRNSTLPFSCLFIHFKTTDELTLKLLGELPNFFSTHHYEELSHIFERIYNNTLLCNEYSVLQNSADLLSLLYIIRITCIQSPKISFTDSKRQLTLKVIDYINIHYHAPITTTDIAAHFNVSVSYLHKLFTQTTRSTPNNYLLNCRINASKDMLLLTDKPLSEIALLCGFSSQSYFCQCFKHSTQTTPSQFRSSHNRILNNAERNPYYL